MKTSRTADLRSVVFRLASVSGGVTGEELVDDRLLRYLVVEDVCWEVGWEAWRARRPHWWRRRRLRDWRGEGVALRRDRERVADLARRCGAASRGLRWAAG
jgi:hypothetical protein